ncbi:MAG: phosphoribosylamine--glycine ligase [Deltaproteobacteria bacterium]|nr:phosphoribosylamine--glycine ligase [Candidatus Zymogenaceae bacterium]
MKILIVGGGGREHALTWKLASEKGVRVYCAPGNGGTVDLGTNVPISAEDVPALSSFAVKEHIDLTIVGPEAPLVLGIVDLFVQKRLPVFGPTRQAAQIEGSKSFSKNLMRKYDIPSAEFAEFIDRKSAVAYIEEKGAPLVVKADGLAAGKGVILAQTVPEALTAVDRIMVAREFGDAGNKVVVEEFLTGEEASFLAFTDGKHVVPLATSQDHKAIYDGDTGPNTGGMGAYSPAPVVTAALFSRIMDDIMIPTVNAMEQEGHPYLGILYAGLMIKNGIPKVLEFNARFGDPEAQPLLIRMKGSLSEVMTKAVEGRLSEVTLDWDERPAVCVVMASGGYPGAYEKGKVITGIQDAEKLSDVVVFHAGTKREGDSLVTSGGRVLGVTAVGRDLTAAIDRAYTAVDRIAWEGAYYRKDIGAKGLRYDQT